MGELHANMNVTLDGVIQANGGPSEQDAGFEYAGWERPFWDDEGGEQVVADVQASDALLLGHTTYESGAPTGRTSRTASRRRSTGCPSTSPHAAHPSCPGTTAPRCPTRPPRCASCASVIEQIHTWGSGNLLQTLFREGLVDQVNLWVHPVVIGTGKKLFPDGTAPTRFELVEPPKAYPAGVMLIRYRRLEGPPETAAD